MSYNDKFSMNILFQDFAERPRTDGGIPKREPINGVLRLSTGPDAEPIDIIWRKNGSYAVKKSDNVLIDDRQRIAYVFEGIAKRLVHDDTYEDGIPASRNRKDDAFIQLPNGDVDTNRIRLAYVSLMRDPFAHMGYTQTIDLAWFSPNGTVRSLSGRTSGHVYLHHDLSDDTWHVGSGGVLSDYYLNQLCGMLLNMFAEQVQPDPGLPRVTA